MLRLLPNVSFVKRHLGDAYQLSFLFDTISIYIIHVIDHMFEVSFFFMFLCLFFLFGVT